MILTNSEAIKKTKEYQKVVAVIEKLEQTGTLWMGRGQCVSMGQIVLVSLQHAGIKSKIVECQLTITNKNNGDATFIGFEGMCNPGQIDTHVVVVTETSVPMFIDASITHCLPAGMNVVIEEVVNNLDNIFCTTEKQNYILTYQTKEIQKIPYELQTSIVERIKTDRKIFSSLSTLKIVVSLALFISVINATRGFYDYYQKYVSDSNMIGISGFETLNERLNRIEDIIVNNKK
jgi:hypothetical protein